MLGPYERCLISLEDQAFSNIMTEISKQFDDDAVFNMDERYDTLIKSIEGLPIIILNLSSVSRRLINNLTRDQYRVMATLLAYKESSKDIILGNL